MKCIFTFIFSIIFIVASGFVGAEEKQRHDYRYVTTEKLNVRLLPNKRGKITNVLYKRDRVQVFEVTDKGWVRVSRFYDGAKEGVSGRVARWVFGKYLSLVRPPENKVPDVYKDNKLADALKISDDFSKHLKAFVEASSKLIASRKCTLEDFKKTGGWFRSVNYKPRAVYFTYCGGMHRKNRIYIDATTGKVFQ